VCDCSDQAAHYHNLGPQLGASLLTRHIGWKQKKKVKKKKRRNVFLICVLTCFCAAGGAEIQTANNFAAGTAGEPAEAARACGGMSTRASSS
jgi:hypothetical protein